MPGSINFAGLFSKKKSVTKESLENSDTPAAELLTFFFISKLQKEGFFF
jgi:hypothetical protein